MQKSFSSDVETQIQVASHASASDTTFCNTAIYSGESVEALHSSKSDTFKIAEILKITKPAVRYSTF